MNVYGRAIRFILVVATVTATFSVATKAGAVSAGNIVVDTTTNTLSDGHCSLPEAVLLVDGLSGSDACARTGSPSIDTIRFAIGSGAQTITLTSTLAVTAPVLIDGSTQPGFVPGSPGAPLITVTGGGFGKLISLQTGSSGSTVRGLRLVNTTTGSLGPALGLETDGITVAGNYFHTDGSASLGGDDTIGVLLSSSAISTIGGATGADRNLFGGVDGVRIDDGGGNTIRNNYFGVTPAGSAALSSLPGNGAAIDLCAYGCTSSQGNIIRDNVVTGFYVGINLSFPTALNEIKGNRIGLGANGTTKLKNGYGIYFNGSDSNTIGGTTAADRNVISGNNENIYITKSGINVPDFNVIRGNYIGTTADGLGRTTPYPASGEDLVGIDIQYANDTTIGGTEPGSGNLISGNGVGIQLYSGAAGTLIRGNWIGADATGNGWLRQNTDIVVTSTSANIGDSTTPGRNVISGANYGISLDNSTGTTINGNRIGVGAFGNSDAGNGWGVQLVGVSSASIARNWIGHNSADGVLLGPSATLTAGSASNCIQDNAVHGAESLNSGASAPLSGNWWGSATGPTHSGNPGGTGDSVTDYVNYSGFRTGPAIGCRLAAADFDGNGTTDVSLYRSGMWYIKDGASVAYGGVAGDVPVPGDYDGDGDVDIAIYRSGMWYIKDQTSVPYGGVPGDVPVPGDYNGDGVTDIAVFRSGQWYINGIGVYSYGAPGDIPVPRDYDGDGDTDIAVYRNGMWYVKDGTSFAYGAPSDIPVPADYDGDGDADGAVFRDGMWYIRNLTSYAYGAPGDIPVPGDYDGNMAADIAVYRLGMWYIKDGTSVAYGGVPGDFPLPAPDTNGDGDPYQ